jgi:hypothetical protein
MSRPVTRALGAFALAAALATSSTAAFASATDQDQVVYAARKKKATTMVGLSPTLQAHAVQALRSRPGTSTLTSGPGGALPSEKDINRWTDLNCGGEWFISWDEDENGDPIIGTYLFHCGESSWGIG